MKNKKNIFLSILVVLLLFVDQFTKIIAVKKLTGIGSKVVIKDFFNLTLVYNEGAAWSIFSGKLSIFIIVALFVSAYLIISFIKSNSKFHKLSLTVFHAGLLGNLIDRVRLYKVIDFLDFNIFGWNFPVFNVADILITVGAIMLGISLFMEERDGKVKQVCS